MDRGGSRVGGKRSRTFAGISSKKVGRWNGSGRRCRRYGEAEARVIAMYEGQQGYANWSLRLLAGKVVELGIVNSISHETVRRTLKKRLLLQKESPVPGDSARKRSSWRNKCLKEKPYDSQRPVVCMDEQPVQLVKETRVRRYRGSNASTTSTNGRAPPSCSARPCPPGAGRRPASAGRRWIGPGKSPARGRYADCERPRVRQPQHLHAGSALRSVLRGRGSWSSEFRYTPKHGSWLNIAENELRIRQCLRRRRLGDLETLQAEAWSVDVNERQRGVDWES